MPLFDWRWRKADRTVAPLSSELSACRKPPASEMVVVRKGLVAPVSVCVMVMEVAVLRGSERRR